MYYNPKAKLALYAEGEFGKSSKTAEGVLRYGLNPIVAVIDSKQRGKTVREITGIDSDAPIVGSIQEALTYEPDALLLGSSFSGGAIPKHWRPDILAAVDNKLDVINGLHQFLNEDSEISGVAKLKGARLIDVRQTPAELPVGTGAALQVPGFTVLTVGSDCSVGKMTVSLELDRTARRRGFSSAFVATGQTGIMIAGQGIAIDRCIGDFMSGATEQMVVAAADKQYIFVEGQGSLVHPSFSGVTLALLHGACPQAMILVANPTRTTVKGTEFPIPSYERLIHIYEDMAASLRPAKIVGIALNTRTLDEKAARQSIEKATAETGLPATDAVRYGADTLFDAILSYQKQACPQLTAPEK